MKSKMLGFFAAMMQLIAPRPEGNKRLIYWYEKKPKSKELQNQLKLKAQIKREVRLQRNMLNQHRGAYTNGISSVA